MSYNIFKLAKFQKDWSSGSQKIAEKLTMVFLMICCFFFFCFCDRGCLSDGLIVVSLLDEY